MAKPRQGRFPVSSAQFFHPLAQKSIARQETIRTAFSSYILFHDYNMSRIMRKQDFHLCINIGAETAVVTAQLINALDFQTKTVQFLFFLNPKFQASSLLRRYRSVCIRPGQKPKDEFSRIAAHILSSDF